MAASDLLLATDAEVRFPGDPEAAVSGVTLALAPGQVLLIEGGAGAGKTSLLRGVLGLAPIAAGEVRLLGARPGDPAALRRVGYAPPGLNFAAGLSAETLLGLLGRIRGLSDPAAAARQALDATVGAEGAGPEARLALACAVLGRPDLLVLDEPPPGPPLRAALSAVTERGGGAVVAARMAPSGMGAPSRRIRLEDGAPAA